MKNITRTVWILSIVSLLTDTASEMLYPIMPVYIKSIGFSIVIIGIIEGITEARTSTVIVIIYLIMLQGLKRTTYDLNNEI